jgi:replicative DNA helicase
VINIFVIDYLELLHSTARRAENRQQEIADISSGIKALAKELDVPIIVPGRLHRELEREKNRKPRNVGSARIGRDRTRCRPCWSVM